jgi:hypothetical protein
MDARTMKKLNYSFTGGEVSPQLFGRIDLDKYQTGLARCLNMRVLPHGPVMRRSGLRYISSVADHSKRVRLIPFSFNAEQTAVVELGHHYVRLYSAGGALLAGQGIALGVDGLDYIAAGYDSPPVPTSYYALGAWVYVSWLVAGQRVGINAVVSSRVVDYFADGDAYGVRLRFDAVTGGAAAIPSGASGLLIAASIHLASPYDEADLFDVHYVQSADVLTLVHPKYAPRELKRLSATEWQLATPLFDPSVTAPDAVMMSSTQNSAPEFLTAHYYKVTALTAGGIEESVASEISESSTTVRTITNLSSVVEWPSGQSKRFYTQVTVTMPHGLQTGDYVAFDDVVGMVDINGLSATIARVLNATQFLVNIKSLDFDPYVSGGTATSGDLNNLTQKGAYNSVNWAAVQGAATYNVYKKAHGIFGYIGQTDELTFKDDNITPDTNKTPPTSVNPFVGTGNYPSTVSYFEQRRCFAATDNNPQNVWMTRPATEQNFASSLPTNDGDAISFRLAAREQNRIRHLVPIDDLIALTVGSEFRIYAAGSDIIAPSTIAARPQTYSGSNNVQPVTTNGAVLYVQTQGDRVREMGYSGEQGQRVYRSNDLCRIAHHLFDDHTIVDMTFASGSQSTLWAVRSDGVLLGLTYVPEEKVVSWHQHDTDGFFESVACVFEDGQPAVYAVVRRVIGGQTRRYIERMSDWRTSTKEAAFFVDSGLSYSGVPVTQFGGLGHLEGRLVSILADGAVVPDAVVSGGAVVLDNPASVVHVGLPFVSELQTLPMVLDGLEVGGQASKKRINKVYVSVDKSSGIFAGGSFDHLWEAKQRTNEAYGSAPNLISAKLEVPVRTAWGEEAQVCLRQASPLPLCVLSVVLEVTTNV